VIVETVRAVWRSRRFAGDAVLVDSDALMWLAVGPMNSTVVRLVLRDDDLARARVHRAPRSVFVSWP
jgi:hypothetical protein